MARMDRVNAEVLAHIERVALTLRAVFDRDPVPTISRYLSEVARLPKATRNLLSHEEPYQTATEWAGIELSEQADADASSKYSQLSESTAWREVDAKAELVVKTLAVDFDHLAYLDADDLAELYASIPLTVESERIERLLQVVLRPDPMVQAPRGQAPLRLTHRTRD